MVQQARPEPRASAPILDGPAAVVRRLHDEIINGDRLDLLDEVVAPEYVNHGPFPWGVETREDLRRFYLVRELGFPDAHVTTCELVETHDLVAYRVVIRATDTGEFLGIQPTGQRIHVAGSGFARVRHGRIVEHWGLVDELGLLEQLGVDLGAIHLRAMRRRPHPGD